ncbi:MAG TPA: plastocyanin/azurin family copper-binding protein [Actinomycetota bacterium]|nr:plastocyanin/azurin family copper-binding protein [Actinomycetota bacterium]
MLRRGSIVVVLAILVVTLVSPASPADTFKIKAAGTPGTFHWEPAARTVAKGDRIAWKNPTSVGHTVTAYTNNSKSWSIDADLAPGGTVKKVFKRRGIYLFRCRIHSTLTDGNCQGMCGEIHVH